MVFDYVPLVDTSAIANSAHFVKYIEAHAPNLSVKFNTQQPMFALLFTKEFSRSYNELNDLERYLRSSIINFETGEIVYRNPAVEANNFIDVTSIEINEEQVTNIESFEGTSVTLYYNDQHGKWYIGTRKTLDAMTAFWKSRRSIGEQVVYAVETATGDCYERFLRRLSTRRSYTMTLTSYEGRGCIDYRSRFGDNYVKLHFLHAWDRDAIKLLVDGFDECREFYGERYPNLGVLSEKNRSEQSIDTVRKLSFEGVLIYNHTTGKVSKIQTDAYRVYAETSDYRDNAGSAAHIIRIYQQHNLDVFGLRFPSDMIFISSDKNTLNTKGLVDIMFKLLSTELFSIFRAMGQQRSTDTTVHRTLQQMFETDVNKRGYRTIFVQIRSTYHAYLKTAKNGIVFSSRHITDMLKKTPVGDIIELWKSRICLMSEIGRLPVAVSKADETKKVAMSNCPYETVRMVLFGIHKKPYVLNLLSMVKFVNEYVLATS